VPPAPDVAGVDSAAIAVSFDSKLRRETFDMRHF
jgi:hypothetical protein